MSNLLITVIAIALAAVAAIMAIFYGGTSFTQAQAQAQANRLIEDAHQISIAWLSYANDHGGDRSLPGDSDFKWGASTSILVPGYLAEMPHIPTEFLSTLSTWRTSQKGFVPRQFSIWAGGYAGNGEGVATVLTYNDTTYQICLDIARMARGPNATLNSCDGSCNGSPINFSTTYDCLYQDTDSSGTLNAGDQLMIVYRVF